MGDVSELVLLFSSAFLAATIFPAQSEVLLVYLYKIDSHAALLLLAVATLGNVLGALVNWLLGRFFIHYQDRDWFPIKPAPIEKATRIFKKWGVWSLLFAWVPFIGDVLTLVSGVLRTNIFLFILLVTIGKAARYAVLLAVI